MSHPLFWNLGLAAAIGLALAGCDAIRKATGGDEDTPAASAAAVAPVARARAVGEDVEAPDAYQSTDKALWDGRPSLGGIWVAAPDVKDPERVIMRNPANGRSVTGALFRRERENPGPKLQLSSDAAEALGLLAGQPATISVTALKHRPVEEPAAPAAPAAAAAPADAGSIGAAAGAAIDRAEAPAAKPAPAAAQGRLIRIGTFSREENARRAAETLSDGGIPARVSASTQQGKEIWSVLAGPAAPAEADAMLAKARGLGFEDAYLLAR
ncbi:SPOR domain-containing protein [Cereibacter sphaeroides]|uniref:SPOR domain-containing protein n=1 Tax=Cereibacter sphaeroides TaxID=1063 RepID=UPI001F329EF3|nr:SPOR domain-containing protein [Cereibacter sphaeroides]MCE6958219.1 SPOR domain-containing protein [Cereibacter sphaeroides]MCE6967698.1 SPOR domain-containing protein [Cereibacter sphaeroides]MCE6972509.1 SPOR domain-containing protein [Cereibacter sphaeroides]